MNGIITINQPAHGIITDQPAAFPSNAGAEPRPTVEQMIEAWIAAKKNRNADGGSPRTERAYRDAIKAYRMACQMRGLDLDGAASLLAQVADKWASAGVVGNSRNQRLACLSSFFTHCRKQGWLAINPLDRLERSKVFAYQHAEPLTDEQFDKIEQIDTSRPKGLRDKAIILLALQTGRRVAEIAGLRGSDVRIQVDGRIRLTFKGKGGKPLKNIIPASVGAFLIAWLKLRYGASFANLDAAAPVWTGTTNPTQETALTTRQLERVCEKWLDTGKFHALRHTFAKMMLDSGARVDTLQAQMSHSNAAITSRYIHATGDGDNPHAGALADKLLRRNVQVIHPERS